MTDDAYRAACRLLDALHPGLQKLPTTVGVITQIDNAIVGMRTNYEAIIRALRKDLEHMARAANPHPPHEPQNAGLTPR